MADMKAVDVQISASNRGFTIVELLIVIVVIGILAAITIVAYNGIQNRSYDTTIQSDLSNMAKKVELEAIDQGSYIIPTAATGIKLTKSAYQTTLNNVYFCRNPTTNQFALSARSRSGKQYKYTQSSGVSENATIMYSVETCNLVSSSYSGNGALGYDATAAVWSAWVN
jgi:prepilin-type N-terminal cleavage/methylation domain-containing protein